MADVYLGRAAVQLPTSEVIEEPLLWLRTMAEHRVTHSWTPNFGMPGQLNVTEPLPDNSGEHGCHQPLS